MSDERVGAYVFGLFGRTQGAGPIHTWKADEMVVTGPHVSLYNKKGPLDSVASIRVATILLEEGQHVARLDCVAGNDNLPSNSTLGPILRK